MAPKQIREDSSSSEEEDDYSSESEDDVAEASLKEKPALPHPEPDLLKKKLVIQEKDSESDDDSDGSDNDSDTQVMPTEDTSKSLKHMSKVRTSAAPSASKSKTPAAADVSASKSKTVLKKRGNGDMQTQDAKRQKMEGGKSEEKSRFQRIWSEDDEIVLLEGLCYFLEKGIDPFKEIDKFHDFIEKNLSNGFDPSSTQVKNKADKMKKKFKKNQNGKGGEAKSLTNPHEQKCFKLSMAIWGTGSPTNTTTNNNNKSGGGDKLEGNEDTEKFVMFPLEEIENIVTKKGLEMVEASKWDEFETRLEVLFQEGLKLYELRSRLMADMTKSILANKAQN